MIVNEKVAIDHGLKKDEYAKICELLKRIPNITELGIFSAEKIPSSVIFGILFNNSQILAYSSFFKP